MKFTPNRYLVLTLMIGFVGFAGPTPPPPPADPTPPGFPINDYVSYLVVFGVAFVFVFFKRNLRTQNK